MSSEYCIFRATHFASFMGAQPGRVGRAVHVDMYKSFAFQTAWTGLFEIPPFASFSNPHSDDCCLEAQKRRFGCVVVCAFSSCLFAEETKFVWWWFYFFAFRWDGCAVLNHRVALLKTLDEAAEAEVTRPVVFIAFVKCLRSWNSTDLSAKAFFVYKSFQEFSMETLTFPAERICDLVTLDITLKLQLLRWKAPCHALQDSIKRKRLFLCLLSQ